jgi:hypothetical protein
VLTGAPTMLGCRVWVPASSGCPKSALRVAKDAQQGMKMPDDDDLES